MKILNSISNFLYIIFATMITIGANAPLILRLLFGFFVLSNLLVNAYSKYSDPLNDKGQSVLVLEYVTFLGVLVTFAVIVYVILS